jgi:hypothetical protein
MLLSVELGPQVRVVMEPPDEGRDGVTVADVGYQIPRFREMPDVAA